jgi:hypothetical protein
MSFIGAVIGGVAAIAGSAMQAEAAGDAADAQSQGLQQSAGRQAQMWRESQANLAPYMDIGVSAASKLASYLGMSDPNGRITHEDALDPKFREIIDPFYAPYGGFNSAQFETLPPDQKARINAEATAAYKATKPPDSSAPGFGSLLKPFDKADLTNGLSPNYDFMLGQGQEANKNMANLSGGLLGGNALQGLNTFTQNYAQNAYQQAYNNYNTNQGNIYSRLMGTAQLGQNSATNSASNSVTAANNIGNTMAAQGAAQGGGIVGASNAMAGGMNNATSYYNLGKIMNGSGSGFSANSPTFSNNGPIDPYTYTQNYG